MANKITYQEMIRIVVILISIFLLWQLKFVVVIVLVAFILTVILRPLVSLLRKLHLPAPLAIVIPLFIFVGALVGLVIYLQPVVSEQLPSFIREVEPRLIELLPNVEGRESLLEGFSSEDIGGYLNLAVGFGVTAFQVIFALLTIIVLTVYWLGDYDKISSTLISYIPSKHRKKAKNIKTRIEYKLGKWFIGQVVVSAVVGLAVWAAMTILGVPYAGILAIIAALLEIFPTIGPIAASIPAIALGATESFEKAIIVTITYIVIQQLESHLLSPVLLGRTVRLHPIVIIVVFLIGSVLFGIVGAMLAVPVALIMSSFVDDYQKDKLPS